MRFIQELKNRLHRLLSQANAPLERLAERQIIMQALSMARTNRSRTSLAGLQEVEFCAFSQWGEDGIIDWLVEKIPGIPNSFVEFGVGDYQESNTRLLLQLRNWRGLVLDGSANHIENIRGQELYWRHDIQANRAFIDRDNINQLIGDAGFKGELGLLSIDIDGNDYWIWQAIDVISPVIVVCEYNAVLGDLYPLTVPYRADFQRSLAHHSLLYFGASLPAMIALGQEKGYSFIGSASSGCNAFFIRNDFAAPILDALEEIRAFPSSAREARDVRGRLTFVGGAARAELINEMGVVDLTSASSADDICITLGSKGALYSAEWHAGAGRKF